jgi:hypothetical protein
MASLKEPTGSTETVVMFACPKCGAVYRSIQVRSPRIKTDLASAKSVVPASIPIAILTARNKSTHGPAAI